MDQKISITAEPALDPTKCKFTVDRPVFPGGSLNFDSPEVAAGSPLAENLLALNGVASVLIANDTVTVTRADDGDWTVLAKEVGATIRSCLLSGEPPLASDLEARLPPEELIRSKVQAVLDREINPAIASHGGVIELLDVKGDVIYIRMGGGCQGCGAADVTLKQGVEQSIRAQVPEVSEILDTTDHAAGTNPFYAASK